MDIVFGAIISDGRGKIGTLVASRNNSARFFRKWIIPPNPRTLHQQNNRAQFTLVNNLWNGLTHETAQVWNLATDEWKYNDTWADVRKLSGQTLFFKLNLQALNAGFDYFLVPPKKIIMPKTLLVNAIFQNEPKQIQLTLQNPNIIARVIIYATPELTPNTVSWKKSIRTLRNDISTNVNPETLYNSYKDKFGKIIPGSNIFLGIKKVMENGQSSPIQVIKLIT